MSTRSKYKHDKEELDELQERINKLSWNANIAQEALNIARYYMRKAEHQKDMLVQLQNKNMTPAQEAVLENKISQLFEEHSPEQITAVIQEYIEQNM